MTISRTNMRNQIAKAPASKKKTYVTKSGIKVTRVKK
tara:strand:- start:326 stop:436 length:111 start_codon:yes stop_codon:yes gene_type:complete